MLAVGQFEFRSGPSPKGFKLIAVGERGAHGIVNKRLLTLKGAKTATCDVTPSGSESPFRSNPWASRNARPRLLT